MLSPFYNVYMNHTLCTFSFLFFFVLSLGCQKDTSHVAPVASSTQTEVPLQTSNNLQKPAFPSKHGFEPSSLQLPIVEITSISNWLGFDISQNTMNHHDNAISVSRDAIIECMNDWSTFTIKLEDWPRAGTQAIIHFYILSNKIELFILEFTEPICNSMNTLKCGQKSTFPKDSCVENLKKICDSYYWQINPNLKEIISEPHTNALEPLNQTLSKCKKLKHDNKEIGYQCDNFALSHIKGQPYYLAKTSHRNDYSKSNVLKSLKLPPETLYVHYQTGFRPYGFNILVYKDVKSFENFLDFFMTKLKKDGSTRHPCLKKL